MQDVEGRMRPVCIMMAAVLLAVAVLPPVCAEGQPLRIAAFDPFQEAVAILNPGGAAADLKGFTISDGEGSWEFTGSLKIPAGETVAFSSNPDCKAFGGRFPIIVLGEDGLRKGKGSLILSNTGDQIYLIKSGKAVDSVCYGNKSIDDASQWSGPPAHVKKGYYALRTGGDTDTAEDWYLCRPGVTEFRFDPHRQYDAVVTPFLFPDSGGAPIYSALASAQEKVEICLYHLGSRNVIALLCGLEDRGVDVTLLLEAEPLGMDVIDYVPMLAALTAHGGEVLLIGGGDDRYSYMHAKYAIIDGKTTIVTSENWTRDNMNGSPRQCSYEDDVGNRGWGAIVESREFALFAEQVFINDSDPGYGDVRPLQKEYPNPRPYVIPAFVPPSECILEGYEARVVPFLSPDSSMDAETYYMESSVGRVYSQQQSVGSSLRDLEEGSPLRSMADAAARGADVRLILGGDAESFCDSLCASTGIKAASMSSPYVHNKGLVCDGTALVSSVNWTENSFGMNREFGVAIESEEVSRYFAEAFLRDHARYYLYEGFEISFSEADGFYIAGEDAVVSVSVSAKGSYGYVWDLGDGRIRETTVPRMAFRPTQGDHVLTVTVTDHIGEPKTADFEYHAAGRGSEMVPGLPLEFWILAAASSATVLAVAFLIRRRCRRNWFLALRPCRRMNTMSKIAVIALAVAAIALLIPALSDSGADGKDQGRGFDPSLSYDAQVTPFVFPDSGGVPIFDAVSKAKKTVYIEIYQFANKNMYALLCDLEKKGVDVILMMEAAPEGGHGIDDATLSRMKALVDAGGEVKLIGDASGDRFSLVHAKYAVVDGKTTTVTSENWTTDNLNGKIREGTYSADYGHRGWGAVIESTGFASYMTSVFMDDLGGPDVRNFSEVYPKATADKNLNYKAPSSGSFKTYSAKVSPMLSPDNSRATEDYWMSKSTSRLYVQQQNIGYSYQDWTEKTSPLFTMNSRASSGVDARLIINDNNTSSLISKMNSGSLIKAADMSSPYVHNKGLVCDDVAIVSSVNWTSNSFNNNREAGAVIQSKGVADYFAGVFEKDFARYYEYSGLSVNITTTQKTYELGKSVTFKVSVNPSGSYTYDWDFGDGQKKSTSVPSVSVTPTIGAHVLKVAVSDSSGQKATASMDYVVVEEGQGTDDGKGGSSLMYLIVVAIAIVATVGGAIMKKLK